MKYADILFFYINNIYNIICEYARFKSLNPLLLIDLKTVLNSLIVLLRQAVIRILQSIFPILKARAANHTTPQYPTAFHHKKLTQIATKYSQFIIVKLLEKYIMHIFSSHSLGFFNTLISTTFWFYSSRQWDFHPFMEWEY